MLTIHVDGSSGPVSKPGFSSWGLHASINGKPHYEACGVLPERGTSNAAEVAAILQGLAYAARVPQFNQVEIFSDSRYVSSTLAILPTIHASNYTHPAKGPYPHSLAWRAVHDFLYEQMLYRRVTWNWLKGHNKDPGNERADRLAKHASLTGDIWSREL